MRLPSLLILAALLMAAQPGLSATDLQPPANTQQDKMKTCNVDATQQELKGEQRQAFMKTCLSGKKLTSSQQRMSDCSKTSASQHLAGDARKKFMSECLKKQ